MRCPNPPAAASQVAAAFARERDAVYAMGIITSAVDARVAYTRRDVLGEDGRVQLVVLEATFDDPALEPRIVTGMEGAHGVIVPPERERRNE